MTLYRLDKLIADSGAFSRREAKELVRSGRVRINGSVASSFEEKFDPASSELYIDGERVRCERLRYYMLNKPAGLLSATEDRDQKTVLDLFPADLRGLGLFCVGRLDKDTTGLLLITNDGTFSHRITSPRSKISKLYRVGVDDSLGQEDIAAFKEGMLLADGTKCLPARLHIDPENKNEALVTIYEGKYHQVKRMFAARGKTVTSLERLAVGGLTLDSDLYQGEYRELTFEERENILA